MYVYAYTYLITEPGDVGMVNIACGAVELINQCNVTWNVSLYAYKHRYCVYFVTDK